MGLRLSRDEKECLGGLVLANGIAWPLGLVAAIVLSAIVGALLMVVGTFGLRPEIIPEENNLLVGLCRGGAVGYAQWFECDCTVQRAGWTTVQGATAVEGRWAYAGGVWTQGTDDQAFEITGTPVPEPTTWVLLGTGLVAVAARRRLTKRR